MSDDEGEAVLLLMNWVLANKNIGRDRCVKSKDLVTCPIGISLEDVNVLWCLRLVNLF